VTHVLDNSAILADIFGEPGAIRVNELAPLSEATVELAMDLRHTATSRIATVDCLIAATAVQHGAILVHRDPHFGALPAGKPTQEVLPDKASV